MELFDVNKWFIQLKDTYHNLLFSQTGTHWTEFGAALVADRLIKRIEHLLELKMRPVIWDQIVYSEVPQKSDNDLERLLNLFWPIHEGKLAYPLFKEDTSSNVSKPKAIVAADSYFWHLIKGPFAESFEQLEFWYYYNTIFPGNINGNLRVCNVDVLDRLIKSDLVIVEFSTGNLSRFGNGFIEDVYNNFTDTEILQLRKTVNNMRRIRESQLWKNDIELKARKRGITFDSMIYLDAQYLAELEIIQLDLPQLTQSE